MRNRSHIQRGSGVYACRTCQHNTRDTGDNGDVRLCPACYTLAGEDNSLSDNGKLYDADSARNEFYALMEQTSLVRAKQLFPRVWSALIQAPTTTTGSAA